MDPGEGMVPGTETDVPHRTPIVHPGHLDYVEPAPGVASLEDEDEIGAPV